MENNEETTNNLEEEKVLLEEYKKLKENTVSREKYEKDLNELKEKNKMYLDAITEGKKIDVQADDNVSLSKKIENLTKFRGTNLEYWKETCSAIDSVLKEMPESEIMKVTGPEGLDELIKVNEGMKQMVADSNGDPDYFRTLYKQRVQDSAPRISAEIEKAGSVFNYYQKNNK